jgi:RNA polymerase sigma factor for flagellar operon FliA
MTEPTPVPDDAGVGTHAAATSPGRSGSEQRSGDRPEAGRRSPRARRGSDGQRYPALQQEQPAGQASAQSTPSNGRPGRSAGRRSSGSDSDQRSADEVEAGIVALWQAFGERRDQELRDRLVLHYAPLVKYVAGRVGTGLPSHVEVSDLIQSGIFGLVDAIEKFEPERGLKFETYAMQRIRGAILDDLRAQDWVPRSVRSRARDVERALERLEAKYQRTATDAELAAELDLSVEDLRELFAQLQMTSVVALDDLIGFGSTQASLAETLPDERAEDPIATLVDRDSRRQLAEAVERLSERDRIVVTLYYFENLTLAEIGKVLGVTESRVCQLHTRAVLRLRSKLTEQH